MNPDEEKNAVRQWGKSPVDLVDLSGYPTNQALEIAKRSFRNSDFIAFSV
jgi:hypothetical protein